MPLGSLLVADGDADEQGEANPSSHNCLQPLGRRGCFSTFLASVLAPVLAHLYPDVHVLGILGLFKAESHGT